MKLSDKLKQFKKTLLGEAIGILDELIEQAEELEKTCEKLKTQTKEVI